jgi:hypothetical protein
MAHRALALLPTTGKILKLFPIFHSSHPQTDGELTMKWRVVEHANEPVEGFEPLKIKSNKKDKEHTGPPNFSKFKLRREQRRSLSWMLDQVIKFS